MCLFPVSLSDGRQVPCGDCWECCNKDCQQWVARMYYASRGKKACMVTLTYADAPSELSKRDVQLFLKRLRKHFFGNEKGDLKYFASGEYGERRGRPHYHILLIGIDFADDRFEFYQKDNLYYRSPTLEALWTQGISLISPIEDDDEKANRLLYSSAYGQKQLWHAEERERKRQRRIYVKQLEEDMLDQTAMSPEKAHKFAVQKSKFPFDRNTYYGKQMPFRLMSKSIGYDEIAEVYEKNDGGKIYYAGHYVSLPRSIMLRMEQKDGVDFSELKEVRTKKAKMLAKDFDEIKKHRQYVLTRLNRLKPKK